MRLIYECMLCGARNEIECQSTDTYYGVLNSAYTPEALTRDGHRIKLHTLHPCAPDKVGVAQLIGVDQMTPLS